MAFSKLIDEAAALTRKPNILFIQADQMPAAAIGAYGNPFAITPHIDSLAERGAIFDNSYCPFPLCAPSRFAMMAGRIPSRIGVYDNASEFRADTPTFAHYLRAGGYRTILSGKMHFVGPDQLHGFEERLTTDIYPGDFTWTERAGEADPNMKSDLRCVNEAGPCLRSVQLDYDEQVVNRAEQKLYDLARDRERPFLLTVSMTHPHDPYYCSQQHWDRYDGVDIPMPTLPQRAYQDHDALGRFLCDRHGFDEGFSDEAIMRARRGYYGSVSYIDDQVGRLMSVLDNLGLSDNTIIMFTSDHGEMLGERGLWLKRHFYESAARVPLIITQPGSIAPVRIEQNVSLIDLLPTLVDLSGGSTNEIVDPIEGRSLSALLGGGDASWDNVAYSEIMSDGLAKPTFMVKRDSFKLMTGTDQGTQLFDVATDPLEETDLAQDPAHRERLSAMQEEAGAMWNSATLQHDIAESIERRILVREAMNAGIRPNWDFHINGEDDSRWCRGGTHYSDWALDVLKR